MSGQRKGNGGATPFDAAPKRESPLAEGGEGGNTKEGGPGKRCMQARRFARGRSHRATNQDINRVWRLDAPHTWPVGRTRRS
jgi:hypothetical protein